MWGCGKGERLFFIRVGYSKIIKFYAGIPYGLPVMSSCRSPLRLCTIITSSLPNPQLLSSSTQRTQRSGYAGFFCYSIVILLEFRASFHLLLRCLLRAREKLRVRARSDQTSARVKYARSACVLAQIIEDQSILARFVAVDDFNIKDTVRDSPRPDYPLRIL
jgi:hypothetical protein